MKHRHIKPILLFLILAVATLLLSGCSEGSTGATSTTVSVILNTNEYAMNQNVYYNDFGKELEGKSVTKKGIFTMIQDAYNQVTRYYVWGYNDNTKCCDWQWEIVPADTASLPPVGSAVTAKGTFVKSDAALDSYWIENATLTVDVQYVGQDSDVHMLAMGDTLERVQLANIVTHPDDFEGKTFTAYGRITALGEIEDPYYDNSWSVPYSSDNTPPAVGTLTLLRGTIRDGILSDCTFETMND